MTDTLRDQLLNLGFKSPPAPERKPAGAGAGSGRPGGSKPGPGGQGRGAPHRPAAHRHGAGKSDAGQAAPRKGAAGGTGEPGRRGQPGQGVRGPGDAARRKQEMDLGKAYALRAQHEKQERIEAEQRKQDEARQRREARARLEVLMQDKGLNDPAAEIARHFEYGGKIKRIYVNEAQLKALNAGALGVVQLNGRYLLVEAAVLDEAEAVFAQAVALRIDPDAPAGEDPYADPRYQVPDDLVW
jgi:uncharacterized protein YaiL (DUF2058 family)